MSEKTRRVHFFPGADAGFQFGENVCENGELGPVWGKEERTLGPPWIRQCFCMSVF